MLITDVDVDGIVWPDWENEQLNYRSNGKEEKERNVLHGNRREETSTEDVSISQS